MQAVPAIEHELKGYFRLTAPASWKSGDEEGTMLFLESPDERCSGIFVGGWSPAVTEETEIILMEATKSFINNGIIEAENQDVQSAETETMARGDLLIARTIVELGDCDVWLIDFVFDEKTRRLFLLHANGPRDLILKVVAASFDTFSTETSAENDQNDQLSGER